MLADGPSAGGKLAAAHTLRLLDVPSTLGGHAVFSIGVELAQVAALHLVQDDAVDRPVPSDVPDRVSFYIDPSVQPLPARTERITPFDLGGTLADGSAGAFNLGDVEEGLHSLLVVAEYTDGETASIEVAFNVEHPEVLPNIAYELLISESADRGGASALSGASLEGQAYIFVSPADHADQATFYLDDPARNSADRVDTTAPFDLVGGTAGSALPLEIDELSSGDHLLTAVVTRSDGTSVEVQATFSVGGSTLPNGSILIKATDNAAQVASQHEAGTTFVFDSGLPRRVDYPAKRGYVPRIAGRGAERGEDHLGLERGRRVLVRGRADLAAHGERRLRLQRGRHAVRRLHVP